MMKIMPQIDRVQKISMKVLVVDAEGNLVCKTLNFNQLPGVCMDFLEFNIFDHMDDILNHRSFNIPNKVTIKFDSALVDVEGIDD